MDVLLDALLVSQNLKSIKQLLPLFFWCVICSSSCPIADVGAGGCHLLQTVETETGGCQHTLLITSSALGTFCLGRVAGGVFRSHLQLPKETGNWTFQKCQAFILPVNRITVSDRSIGFPIEHIELIHSMYGIYAYIEPPNHPNVGKYGSPMEHLGNKWNTWSLEDLLPRSRPLRFGMDVRVPGVPEIEVLHQ